MIKKQETQEKFGYPIEKLSSGSHKIIIVECEYCGKYYEPEYKNYLVARKKYENIGLIKDACKQCGNSKGLEAERIRGTDLLKKEKIRREKIKETCLEKYGTEFAFQSEEIKRKIRQAFEEKTKEELLEIQEKRQVTNLEKYGTEHTWGNKELKAKQEKTMIEKYGVINPSLSKDLCNKRLETTRKNLGVDNPGQNEEVKERIKNTNFEKYDGKYFISLPENVEKGQAELKENKEIYDAQRRETSLKKYGTEHPTQSQAIKDKTFETLKRNGNIRLIDGKKVKDFAKERGMSVGHANVLFRAGRNLDDYNKYLTTIEIIVRDILIKNNLEFKTTGAIENRKYDFLIDNLVIECDGNYYHSDALKPIDYHKIKKDFYTEKSFKSVFFRADEIMDKKEIIESIILNKLGKSKPIFARKCKMILVDRKIGVEWLKNNHLMGKGRGYCFGLLYENEIVAIMQICLKNKSKREYEISRFATKLNTSIVGGYSRLLKFAETSLDIKSLITFVDLRYGEGTYLKDLGFEYIDSHLSFVWTNGKVCFHRMQFPGDTGYESRLFKLWDCGQAKYVKYYI